MSQRTFHVRVHYTHCAGHEFDLPAEESWITFVHHYEVEGVWMWPEYAELRFTPFGQLWLNPAGEENENQLEYNQFLESLALDDVLEESNFPELYVIPVSSLEMIVHTYAPAPPILG